MTAAYLFGSRARGGAGPRSDTDVALLFRDGMNALDRFERRLEIATRLERAVAGRVDVVDVEAAGPVLVHQILKYGQLLLDREPGRRVRFEVAVRRRYFDGARRRREHLRRLLDGLERGEARGGTGTDRGALEAARRIHRRLGRGAGDPRPMGPELQP